MSTRGAIARQHGDSFTGRYHHFDSYPEGLGQTLWQLYHNEFGGNLPVMLKFLIDDHPAGWSTINNVDWSIAAGTRARNTSPCTICGAEMWRHYAQYYPQHGLAEPPHPPSNYTVLGHSYEESDTASGPECYCHGASSDEEAVIDEANAAASGCEWVYVFAEGARVMSVLASYNGDGSKMIGMFGMGNRAAKWRIVASFSLDGPEPNWGTMSKTTAGEDITQLVPA